MDESSEPTLSPEATDDTIGVDGVLARSDRQRPLARGDIVGRYVILDPRRG